MKVLKYWQITAYDKDGKFTIINCMAYTKKGALRNTKSFYGKMDIIDCVEA